MTIIFDREWFGVAVWGGSDEEYRELRLAVERNCTCEPNQPPCQPHVMLATQEELNRLQYARRLRAKYLALEWLVDEVDG